MNRRYIHTYFKNRKGSEDHTMPNQKDLRWFFTGGGTGLAATVGAIKNEVPEENITACPSITDRGGCSGLLRAEYPNSPAVGDLRHVIEVLAKNQAVKEYLHFRFPQSLGTRLSNTSLGNLMLMMRILNNPKRNFPEALAQFCKDAELVAKVLPPSEIAADLEFSRFDKTKLLYEGLTGTHAQERGYSHRQRIVGVGLSREMRIYKPTEVEILKAHRLVICQGSFFSSTVPNLLVKGFVPAFKTNQNAELIYIINLMTDEGESPDWAAHDYVKHLKHFLHGRSIDTVICNTGSIPDDILRRYAQQGSHPVPVNVGILKGLVPRVITGNFVGISTDSKVCHNEKTLGKALVSI